MKGCEAGSTEGPQHPLVSEIEREKVKPSREGIPESNRGRITSENRAYPREGRSEEIAVFESQCETDNDETSRLTQHRKYNQPRSIWWSVSSGKAPAHSTILRGKQRDIIVSRIYINCTQDRTQGRALSRSTSRAMSTPFSFRTASPGESGGGDEDKTAPSGLMNSNIHQGRSCY